MTDLDNENERTSLDKEDDEDDDEEDDDDVHVCGGCKQEFRSIDLFVSHKRECKAKKKKKKGKAAPAPTNRVSVIVDLGKGVRVLWPVLVSSIQRSGRDRNWGGSV